MEGIMNNSERTFRILKSTFLSSAFMAGIAVSAELTYPIVSTGTTAFYDDSSIIVEPKLGEPYFGQDANFPGTKASYTDNGDGTISDNVTGLLWQKDMGSKIVWSESFIKADTMTLGGYDDWRMPTIKELYSLIKFDARVFGEKAVTKFIDTTVFVQPIGDTTQGVREIDAQTWSSTKYMGLTMGKDTTIFGVNFVDGRIKGYPQFSPKTKTSNVMYTRMVRGNPLYGKNSFVDNGDETISDLATGLMWQKADDSIGRDWEHSLSYADTLTLAGHTDWRLPSAKELQSIVDYSRSPQTTNSPAIDPLFNCTSIIDPNGKVNYPFYWSSTTHLDGKTPGNFAVYLCFGEALGKMNGVVVDVHGAGAQRSDFKSGDISLFPSYSGPQGDIHYVYNYVRAVRNSDQSVGISSVSAVKKSASISYSRRSQKLSISLTQTEPVIVTLFNLKGAVISSQNLGMLNPGEHSIAFPTNCGAQCLIAVVKTGSSIVQQKITTK